MYQYQRVREHVKENRSLERKRINIRTGDEKAS